MVVGRGKRDEPSGEEESHSWSRNAVGSFWEVTGANRVHASRGEVRVGDQCTDVVTALGRRVSMGNSKSYLALFVPASLRRSVSLHSSFARLSYKHTNSICFLHGIAHKPYMLYFFLFKGMFRYSFAVGLGHILLKEIYLSIGVMITQYRFVPQRWFFLPQAFQATVMKSVNVLHLLYNP